MAGQDIVFLLKEILESSSSSEDEMQDLLLIKEDRPKVGDYINIISEYSDTEFQRNFRMKRSTYEILADRFRNSRFYHGDTTHGGSAPIPANVQLLSFLWFAGNKSVIRDVASRFGIAESTFHKVSTHVMDFLIDCAPTIIKFPQSLEEKVEVARKFEEISGFPGVLGCIDGTYIPIRTPAHKVKSTYVNRHDFPSLTLQAVCNADKMFLDVFTGPPSKCHDAKIFKLSFLSDELEQICDDQWHIIGDAAYPIKKCLLTPYRDYGNLTPAQKNFNFKFSATRVKIENAFGLLKGRFRQLTRIDFLTVERCAKFIICCCVLHNLCIMNDDQLVDEMERSDDLPDDVEISAEVANENCGKTASEEKREIICNLLQ